MKNQCKNDGGQKYQKNREKEVKMESTSHENPLKMDPWASFGRFFELQGRFMKGPKINDFSEKVFP